MTDGGGPELQLARRARLTLCALTLLAYASSFTAGFVLDSKGLLLEDPRIRQATSGNISLIFHRTYWWPYTDSNLYRPLTTLSYLFNYAILGNSTHAAGYHVVNLLLHGANVLLLYALALRLSRRVWPSFFVAAIWAVHPLSTEAVTNLVGRTELLAGLGVLGGLYAYVRSAGVSAGSIAAGFSPSAEFPAVRGNPAGERSEARWFLAALMATTLGVFSKESAVVVVGVIVIFDVLFRLPQTPLRSIAGRWALLLLPIAALLLVRSLVIPSLAMPDPFVDNPIVGAGFWSGRLTALSVAGRYLWLILWPARLSSDYSYAQIPRASGTPTEWLAWIAVLCFAAAALALVARSVQARMANAKAARTKAKGPGLRSVPKATPGAQPFVPGTALAGFALAFACVAFLPASNLLFSTGTIMAERLMYLPSAGVAACLVVVLCGVARLAGKPVIVPVVAGIVVAALGARTFARNFDWRDDVTLWRSAARVAPGSFKAHQGLADALYEADPNHGALAEVIDESNRSVAILDPLPNALNVTTAYRRAAGYQLENGDRLRESGTPGAAASRSAYERSVALTVRYLAIVEATRSSAPASLATAPAAPPDPGAPSGSRAAPPVPMAAPTASAAASSNSAWDLSEAYVMLATGYSRLQNTEKALDAARQAQALQPLNSIPYRVIASALLDVNRFDEAAVWLLAGFTVTGDPELRQATIDLYQHGGDPKGCALKSGDDGPVLNPECETVRQQLCAATVQAMQIQTQAGRADLADQLRETTIKTYSCR